MNANLIISSKYYYSNCLTEEQQELYRVMMSGVESYLSEIKIPALSSDEIEMIFNYIMLNNPSIELRFNREKMIFELKF